MRVLTDDQIRALNLAQMERAVLDLELELVRKSPTVDRKILHRIARDRVTRTMQAMLKTVSNARV